MSPKLDHDAIRQHLAELFDAGLVVEQTALSSGRGVAEVVRSGDSPVEAHGITVPKDPRRAHGRLRCHLEPVA